MTRDKRNKKVATLGRRVCEEDADYRVDVRLARRWKRRLIADQNLKLNSCSYNARKKTVEHAARMDTETVDDDYRDDVKLARRQKRRLIADKNFKVNSCSYNTRKKTVKHAAQMDTETVDEDYERFLNTWIKYGDSDSDAWAVDDDNDDDADGDVDARSVDGDDDDANGDVDTRSMDGDANGDVDAWPVDGNDGDVDAQSVADDDADPQYKLFLEKLREVGKSYVLEVAGNDEMLVHVKYEKEDMLCDGHEVETLNTSKDCLEKEINENARSLKSVLSGEKIQSPKDLSDISLREDSGRPKIKRNISKKEKTKSPKTLSCQLRRERKSLGLDLSDVSLREDSGKPKIKRNISKKEKTKSPKTLSCQLRRERKSLGLEMDEIVELADSVGLRTRGRMSKRPSPVEPADYVALRTRGCMSKRPSPVEPAEYVALRTRGRTRKRPSPEVLHPAKRKCNGKMECGMVDESYQVFLNYIKRDGDLMVFTQEGGKQVKYEEDKENSSDSEVIIMDNDPYLDGNYTPFVTSKSFNSCMDADGEGCFDHPGRSKHSQFREKLMDILKLPYDPKQYDDLLQKASRRCRMERHIDFRSRVKPCLLDSVGKSYLDQFTDLAKKIDSVRCDRPRILNLLRGFFYWLQNLAHGGVFKPWLDSSCLEVLPKT